MPNEKTGFLIHRDAYMHVMALSPEQRGELFGCLFWFAERVAQRGYLDVTVAAAQCTNLTPEAKMAFRFMADSIQRDTMKWRDKQTSYLAAAERRAEKRKESAAPMPFKGKGVDVYPSEEEHKALLEG